MKNHTSISHLTYRERQALQRLKNKIVTLYKPLIIYLVGCNSTTHITRNCLAYPKNSDQWHCSCDLLLVLPEGIVLPENAAKELKSIHKDYEHIHLIVHSFDFVIKQLQEYSLFFCWVQRNAIVLYEREHSCEKLPEQVQNIKQYAKQVNQFFTDNPDYENYADTKLSPLPLKPAAQSFQNPAQSKVLIDSFKSYLKNHPPKTVNRNIRDVLLEYIVASKDGRPLHFKEIIRDFTGLMGLFDVAEDAGGVKKK